MRALVLWLFAAFACAVEVQLASPMVTVVEAPAKLPPEAMAIAADVVVPDDAPPDLGIGAFVRGDDGRWFQRVWTEEEMTPGRHRLRIALDDSARWSAEPRGESWTPYRRALGQRFGLFAWSASASRATLGITLEAVGSTSPGWSPPWRLRDLGLDGFDARAGVARGRTGERWELNVRPSPWPSEPYDPEVFALDLSVTAPSGAQATIPGFYDQPMRLSDRGDREVGITSAPASFRVRFRPREPGRHRLRLIARWRGGHELALDLPDLEVGGEPHDDIVHVDRRDPRFFSVGDAFCWPIGINLASPRDYGATKDPRYGIRPTPDRGTFSYDAYFARLAAAGGDAAEIWLSTWNLGLEWSPTWFGYHGIGRYNEFNAARLDRTLDLAWSRGVRLVLNLNNHGQVLANSGESEWQWNPINKANGGWIADPQQVFTDARALKVQDNLRRYIAARYADHPGVLIWKLYSEVDLTQLGIATIRSWKDPRLLADWHRRACDDWHRLDSYRHPVATHVATTYQNAHPAVFSLRELDAIGLDAYYERGVYTSADTFFGLMCDTMFDPGDGWRVSGVARWRKPVFITEYGGGWREKSKSHLEVEHRCGAWLALVTGEAASPMLWWHEWVDQQEEWAPYGAIRRFIAGEDLRGAGSSAQLRAGGGRGELRAQAWRRLGRVLAYAQDLSWSRDFADPPRCADAWIELSGNAEPGTVHYEWWDPDLGVVIDSGTLEHGGGPLRLQAPTFHGHIALKAWR